MKAGVQAATGSNDSSRALPAALNTVDVDSKDKGLNTSGKLTHKLGDEHRLMTGWEASTLHHTEDIDELNLPGLRKLSDIDARIVRSAAFAQDE